MNSLYFNSTATASLIMWKLLLVLFIPIENEKGKMTCLQPFSSKEISRFQQVSLDVKTCKGFTFWHLMLQLLTDVNRWTYLVSQKIALKFQCIPLRVCFFISLQIIGKNKTFLEIWKKFNALNELKRWNFWLFQTLISNTMSNSLHSSSEIATSLTHCFVWNDANLAGSIWKPSGRERRRSRRRYRGRTNSCRNSSRENVIFEAGKLARRISPNGCS